MLACNRRSWKQQMRSKRRGMDEHRRCNLQMRRVKGDTAAYQTSHETLRLHHHPALIAGPGQRIVVQGNNQCCNSQFHCGGIKEALARPKQKRLPAAEV